MAGGSEADFARVAPVLETYAARLVHIGAAGTGQLTKMVNQICVAGLVQELGGGRNDTSSLIRLLSRP